MPLIEPPTTKLTCRCNTLIPDGGLHTSANLGNRFLLLPDRNGRIEICNRKSAGFSQRIQRALCTRSLVIAGRLGNYGIFSLHRSKFSKASAMIDRLILECGALE